MDKVELDVAVVDVELVDDFLGDALRHPQLLQLAVQRLVQMKRISSPTIECYWVNKNRKAPESLIRFAEFVHIGSSSDTSSSPRRHQYHYTVTDPEIQFIFRI